MLRITRKQRDGFRGVAMKARLAVAGSVMAGLVAVGGVAAVAAFQPSQAPAPATVRMVQPAADTSTIDPTVAPTETAAVAPVVVPTTQAPAPVESTQAPVQVAPTSEAIVPKVVATTPAPGTYADGRPVVKDANGEVIPLPMPPNIPGTGPQIDGHGVPIPTPTP